MMRPHLKRDFQLKIDTRFSLFFIILFLLFSQLHEFSHILTGRLICGCFGLQRDFNVWSLCGACFQNNTLGPLATLAGPFFSFALIWTGIAMLYAKNKALIFQGLLLIFINKPFARLFTVLTGGGDELMAMRKFFEHDLHPVAIRLITTIFLIVLTLIPLWCCYKKLLNKSRLLMVIGLCVLPMLFQYFYSFKILNRLLAMGVFSTVHFMGIADLILVHTLLMLILAAILYRGIIRKQVT